MPGNVFSKMYCVDFSSIRYFVTFGHTRHYGAVVITSKKPIINNCHQVGISLTCLSEERINITWLSHYSFSIIPAMLGNQMREMKIQKNSPNTKEGGANNGSSGSYNSAPKW
jgi:hypothetical protein